MIGGASCFVAGGGGLYGSFGDAWFLSDLPPTGGQQQVAYEVPAVRGPIAQGSSEALAEKERLPVLLVAGSHLRLLRSAGSQMEYRVSVHEIMGRRIGK